MHYVYVLTNTEGKFYIGQTSDLKRRLNEHHKQKIWTTKRTKSLNLIFYEGFVNKIDSLRREKYLKTTKGRITLRLMLRNYLDN